MSTIPPIWTALINRDINEMTEILTKDPSQVTTRRPRGNELPLDSALYWGYFPEAKLLFSFGAPHDNSPLGSSLKPGNPEQLQWTYDNLDKNVNDPSLPDACFGPLSRDDVNLSSFKFLLDNGADHKPFMFNACLLSPLSTQYLVERGLLELNHQTDSAGRTILDLIELRLLPHPYQLYLLPDKSNELFYAVTKNDLETLNKSPLNVNKPLANVYGTPLLYALSIGNVEACKILISKGASTKFKNPFGKFALAYAVESKNIESVKLALSFTTKKEIDSLFNNKRGMENSVLERAVNNACSTDIFKLLLTSPVSCDPDVLCQGITAVGWLGYAITNRDLKFTNHVEIFKLLVDSGSKVDNYNSVLRRTPRNFYIYSLLSINTPNSIITDIAGYKKN